MDLEDKYLKSPIFIGGTGRSGTTILSRILGKHKDVYRFPFETRFIIDPDGIIDLLNIFTRDWSPYRGSKALKRFTNLMDDLFIDRSKLITRIKNKLLVLLLNRAPDRYRGPTFSKLISKRKYQELIERYLSYFKVSEFKGSWNGTTAYSYNPTIISSYYMEREALIRLSSNFIAGLFSACMTSDKRYCLDHTPFNILHGDFLLELFPDMRLIHVYRDVRDVISSYITKRWGGNNASEIVLWIKKVLERWLYIRGKLPSGTYLEVMMEDLINDRDKKIIQIQDFLGISIDKDLLDIDLTHGHIGRWKEDLSDKDKELIRSEMTEVMSLYGYEW